MAAETGRIIHRGAVEGAPARYRKKILARTDWFKDQEKGNRPAKGKEEYLFSPEKTTPPAGYLKNIYPCNAAAQNKNSRSAENAKKPNKNKDKNKVKPTTCVLFVEQTARGEYAKSLRAAEPAMAELTGFRVKVVERGGTTLRQLLVKSNPWAGGKCGREKCVPC